MNWVGGSRNRLVMKNDAKKQREFFEKRKMQQRLQKLGLTLPPSSPGGISCGSTDLMNLFIVNQIATKKENKDLPKVSILGRFKGGSRSRKNEPLVLPMSPCSPSQLSLAGSPSQCRVQEIGQRKNAIKQKLKCPQLSPVVESAFSDNSASDYLPPVTIHRSPISSGSSGQGIFTLQMNRQKQSQSQLPLPCFSTPQWDTSEQHSQFQLFCQPRGLTDSVFWSDKSTPPLFGLETPTAALNHFGRPEPDELEIKNGGTDAFFSQPEEPEPALNFQLNPTEPQHPFEEDVFRQFGGEDFETEDFNNGCPKSKIYLADEASVRSSTPQIVPSALNMELSSNMNFSCPEQNIGLLKVCEHSPSCSCRAGYLSSDSSDGESCCEPASEFYVNEARCEDNLKNTQRNPKPSKLRLHIPPLNHGDDQIVVDQTSGCQMRQTAPSSCETLPCGCKKPAETQDAGTQTTSSRTPETCDASTQCESKAAGFDPYRPAADGSEPEPQTPTASSHSAREERWAKQGENRGRDASIKDEGREVRGQRLSVEAETLQEIANILLLLKQKKEKLKGTENNTVQEKRA